MSALPNNGTIAGADCARILEAIRNAGSGGMTCDEVELRLGLSHQTATARIHDLCAKTKAIHASEARRKTRSGGEACVYRLGPRPVKPQQIPLELPLAGFHNPEKK